MKKWKNVRVRQELVEEIKKGVEVNKYTSLSEFVSKAMRLRLQKLTKERIPKYLERDAHSRTNRLETQSLYTQEHTWAQATPCGNVKIGITDFFQSQVKDIAGIQIDQPGQTISKDEPFGIVESWWFVYDLYAPLDGRIVSINEKVTGDPSALNVNPYQWIVEVEPTDVNSWMKGLISPERYEELVAKLEGRPVRKLTEESLETSCVSKDEQQKKLRWKTIPIEKQLLTAAKSTLKKERYKNLSEFVTEAIQQHLNELRQSHQTITEQRGEYPVVHERLLYNTDHVWALVTPEGNVRVGLSSYSKTRLKGIAGIQIDPIGSEVKNKEPFGVVETWMFTFDLYSPISGKIVKINEALQEDPSVINENPSAISWIAEIKPNNLVSLEEESRDLMKSDQYKTWVSKLSPPRILSL